MKSVLLAFYLSILATCPVVANDAPLVAAASSLRQVWPLLMQAYTPIEKPRVTFGSSGNLTRQILQGAPFELFLSADVTYTEQIHTEGKSSGSPVPYTIGALAWVALPNTPLAHWLHDTTEHDSTNYSSAAPSFPLNGIAKLSIANPAFAPYGQAAIEALAANNVNTTSRIKYTMGENAAQALQFALSGATGGGLVPLSLVSGTAKEHLPDIVVNEIDTSLHRPLLHSMVLIDNPSASAQSLFYFLLSEQAQNIFEQNGFRAIN